LRAALCRNVFADEDRPGLDALTAYVEAAALTLDGQDATVIANGRIAWPDPAAQA
jgi:hypothetical protein